MKTYLYENNYVYIPQFISKTDAVNLANEFKEFTVRNKTTSDNQVEGSPACYDYIGFLELLCEKTNEVSRLIGEKVLPTYSYARVYKNGAILEPHVDRESCEISLTVHLDGDKDWLFYIENPMGKVVNFNLKAGDAILYLGMVGKHWREQYIGNEYVQVFLHYVKSRGENNFAYFDKTRLKPRTIPTNLATFTPALETK